MNSKKIAVAAALFLALHSCEEDREIVLPKLPPTLVIHGYNETGEYIKIAVGRVAAFSDPVSSPSSTVLTNAFVELYENGIKKDTMLYDQSVSRYVSSKIIAVPGNTYKVVVKVQDYATAEASSVAPAFVNSAGVVYRQNVRFDVDGNSLNDIIFRFNDPPGEKNFYLVNVARTFPAIGFIYDYFCTYSYDPVIEQYQNTLSPFETGSCISNRQIIFTDKSFNGALKEITISGQSDYMIPIIESNRTYRPYLVKYNITEEYYKYIKANISLETLDDNPFAEPVITTGNVKNGYGLFTIFSAVTDTLR